MRSPDRITRLRLDKASTPIERRGSRLRSPPVKPVTRLALSDRLVAPSTGINKLTSLSSTTGCPGSFTHSPFEEVRLQLCLLISTLLGRSVGVCCHDEGSSSQAVSGDLGVIISFSDFSRFFIFQTLPVCGDHIAQGTRPLAGDVGSHPNHLAS